MAVQQLNLLVVVQEETEKRFCVCNANPDAPVIVIFDLLSK